MIDFNAHACAFSINFPISIVIRELFDISVFINRLSRVPRYMLLTVKMHQFRLDVSKFVVTDIRRSEIDYGKLDITRILDCYLSSGDY